MPVRSAAPCPRCGGPMLHLGVCTDSSGDVYPDYAVLAAWWVEQGRPAVTADDVVTAQDALRIGAEDDEGPA